MKSTTLSLAAAAIGLCFAACSNDNTEIDPTTTPGGSGDPASLTLTIGQPSSRAADDTNAIDAEVKFITADVFIYEDNTLRIHERLTKDDFTDKGDNIWEAKNPIVTTTGWKEIYVGLNMPLQLGKDMAAKGNKSALELVGNTDTYSNTLDSATDGFVMFSAEKVTYEMLPEVTNRVSIPVERIVAKITVQEGSSLNLSLTEGELDNLRFAMRNSNKLFYPFQKKDAADVVYDPNWLPGEYNVNDFNQADIDTDYVPVNADGVAVKLLNVKYAPENTSRDYLTRETTYASVKATFVPKEFSDDEGKLTPYSGPAKSFWVVKLDETGETYYFDDVDVAKDFATNKGEVSDEYVDGVCYYNLFLNPKGKFQTKRNTYYQLRIASITGLGNPNPEDEGNTDKPVTEPADLIIEVDIQPWDLVSDSYDLF